MHIRSIVLLFFSFTFRILLYAQPEAVMYTMESARKLESLVKYNKNKNYLTPEVKDRITLFFAEFSIYGDYKKLNDSILLEENPFINKGMLINQPILKPEEPTISKSESTDKTEGLPPNPPARRNWQTAVLDGTARFLAQRFKEEMAAYYLNTFYGKLENKPIVKTLFPKTVAFLRVFANQVYNTDIAMLQVSAEEDLSNLPENLINSMEYIPAFKKTPLIKEGLTTNLNLFKELRTGINMAELINQMPAGQTYSEPYKNAFSLLRILSNAIRSSRPAEVDGPWHRIKDVDFYDPSTLNNSYFYALLYEQVKNISFKGRTLRKILGKDPDTWKKWFASFADVFQEIKSYNRVLEEEIKIPDSKADFWQTLYRSGRLVNKIYPVLQKIPGDEKMVPVPVLKVAENTNSFFQLIKRVEDKRYEQIVPNIILLFTSLDDSISHAGIIPTLRYAAVITQFATVRTAEDMKNLLQSVALPIGSASIKRKSKWNISFNAYVGAAIGQEQLKRKELQQNKTSIGLSAPLGIGISHQFGKQKAGVKEKGRLIPSGTLYLSFMDIGNLVNVRLKSDTTSIGDVRFSHFISLGAGYFLNFRNSPFSAGVSWTYVPGYRDAFIENKWIYKADVVRIRFSLLVDIPLFNLYTKPNE